MTDAQAEVDGPGSNVQNESEEDIAAAFLESQLAEHSKIVRMSKFLRRGDELENSIADAISNMLRILPSAEATEFSNEDVVDIIYGLPPVETIQMSEFFVRPAVHCRLLRRNLGLHLINPIKAEQMSSVVMTDDERGDPRLAEQVWFLLFLRAPPVSISETLTKIRDLRTNISVQSVQSERKGNSHHSNANSFRNVTSRQDDRKISSEQYEAAQNVPSDPKIPLAPQFSSEHFQNNCLDPNNLEHNLRLNENSNLNRNRPPQNSNCHNGRTSPADDASFAQSKKGLAVESYFRNKRFTGAPEQAIDNLIPDYEICAAQQCLDGRQMSLFFVNSLADPAREHFLTHCYPRMNYEQIAAALCRHYNSKTRKLQLQSEMDSLDLFAFMRKSHYVDFNTGLRKLVRHINALAPQLPHGFDDDAHKTRYLRRAVMRHNWANTPISQITSARYSFSQFINALQESLHLQDEISRASAPADPIINYGYMSQIAGTC